MKKIWGLFPFIVVLAFLCGCLQNCPPGMLECNGTCYNATNSSCCEGKVVNELLKNCNGTCYNATNSSCCEGRVVNELLKNCNGTCYNATNSSCCEGRVVNELLKNCNGTCYNATTDICVDGVLKPRSSSDILGMWKNEVNQDITLQFLEKGEVKISPTPMCGNPSHTLFFASNRFSSNDFACDFFTLDKATWNWNHSTGKYNVTFTGHGSGRCSQQNYMISPVFYPGTPLSSQCTVTTAISYQVTYNVVNETETLDGLGWGASWVRN
jgi:hypothetical protein